MGGNGLKVDWKKATRDALRREVDEWNAWKWGLMTKRMKSYKMLLGLKQHYLKTGTEKWEWQYYLRQLKPNFGASHQSLGLSRKDYSELEIF